MLHTFDGPCYMKNEKYMKKRVYNHVFHVEMSIEIMQHGYSLDGKSNYASHKCFRSKIE